jgi:hypothetical protein
MTVPRLHWYAAEPANVGRAVEAVAAGLGIELLTPEDMRAQAEAAVQRVCATFEELRSTGKLRDLNPIPFTLAGF